MSFISGFMFGQATSGKNNVGEGAVFFVYLIAMAFTVMMICATVVSFVGPLYSLIHFKMWAAQAEFYLPIFVIWITGLPILLLGYLFSLCGTRKQYWIAGGMLAALNIIVFATLDNVEGHLLLNWTKGSDASELLGNGLVSASLCLGALFVLRFVLQKKMKARQLATAMTWPIQKAAIAVNHKAISGLILVGSAFGLLISWSIPNQHADIMRIMMSNGTPFRAAFEARMFVSFERYLLSVAVVFLIGLFAGINLIRLRRKGTISIVDLSSD